MIKLYFLPDKGNSVYLTSIKNDGCIMDAAVVDIAGLISHIEKRLGCYVEPQSFNKRLCHYYIAAREWFGAHPDNVVRKSFDLSHLSTTRQLLLWRDELKTAGWDFVCDNENSRLGALAGIEAVSVVGGLPDRLCRLLNVLEVTDLLFGDTEIVIPTEMAVLRPSIKSLLQLLEKRGAEVTVIRYADDACTDLGIIRKRLYLNDSCDDSRVSLVRDGSLSIMEFDTTYKHDQYMAVGNPACSCDVWVNPRSKETDNRLIAINQPTIGSTFTSQSRILGMLPLALSLYDENLNIYKIVEWLSTPVHPLSRKFRYNLAQAIANTGGFINDSCGEIIQRYLDGEFEYVDESEAELSEEEQKKREKTRRKSREEKVAVFIPYLSEERSDEMARKTLTQLASWARQRIHTLNEEDGGEALALQLNALAEGIDILMMLFDEQGIRFDIALAREWVNDVPVEIVLPHCSAQVGAAFAVTNPSDIVATASHILWSGMTYSEPQSFDCDFLLPGELKTIQTSINVWDRQSEGRYRYLLSIMPFLLAQDKLALAYALKDQGEVLIPHPIITRLGTLIDAFESCVEHPDLEDLKTQPVERVDNAESKREHSFKNAGAIQLPELISPTRLETFTMNPFDYLFEKVLRYQSSGLSALSPLNVTKGNVAHATIASLCSPRVGEQSTDASTIRLRFDSEFEEAFKRSINDCGAILLLPENKLEIEQMKRQLRACIESLIEIIALNNLSVVSCESEASKYIDIHGNGSATQDPDLHGRLDMILSDASGSPVVFDMKWTASRSFYRTRLEENRSVQLAVYAELLSSGTTDVKTGYFVMPRGRLLSTAPFVGEHVEVVEKKNQNDIMQQLVNSFRYRCNQLKAGIVEQGELFEMTELMYENDRAAQNLLPLEKEYKEETKKAVNGFSNYSLFKGYPSIKSIK